MRAIEYGYLAVLGDARAVSAPLVCALITVLAPAMTTPPHAPAGGVGHVPGSGSPGPGRAPLAGPAGPLPFAYAVPAPYLGVLSGGGSAVKRVRNGRGSGVMVDLARTLPGDVGGGPHKERERRA